MRMTSSKVLPSGEPSKLGLVPERLERLHWRIQQFVDDGQHAGVSLLLMRNGEIADTFAAGLRNREFGLPMSRCRLHSGRTPIHAFRAPCPAGRGRYSLTGGSMVRPAVSLC